MRCLFVRLRPNSANATRREIFTALNLVDFQFHVFCCFDTFGTNRIAWGFTASNGATLRVTGWDTGWAAGSDHYLICIYNQTTLDIYSDGSLSPRATNSFSDVPDVDGMELRIGNHAFDTNQSFDGTMYEVAWYDVMLSSDEMSALFAGFSPLLLPRLPAMYWPMKSGPQEIIGGVATTVTGATVANENMPIYEPADDFRFMAEIAGTAVQQVAQRLGLGARKGGLGSVVRRVRARLQGGHPLLLEGVDGIAHALLAAPQGAGDLGHRFLPGTGEQDLGAAQREGAPRMQSSLQRLPLTVGQRSDEEGRFHAPTGRP
jgi:hypothetical protein